MHVFEVLSDPVRRRILELLAPRRNGVRRGGRSDRGRVRDHAGGGLAAPQGAARERLCRRPGGGAKAASIRWTLRGFARWMRGSASSGISGSRSWTRWQRRSRAASASVATRRSPSAAGRGREGIANLVVTKRGHAGCGPGSQYSISNSVRTRIFRAGCWPGGRIT